MKTISKIFIVGILYFQFQFLKSQTIEMIGGGYEHTNVYDTKALKGQPKLKWKFKSGELIWRYKTESGASCLPPVVQDNKVYFGSHDKHFYVLDSETGDVIKIINTGHEVCSSPSIDENNVYFSDWGGHIHAVNLKNYEENWKFKAKYTVKQTPTLDGSKIYFPSFDKYVYCINKDNGELMWEKNMNAVVTHIGLDWQPFIL